MSALGVHLVCLPPPPLPGRPHAPAVSADSLFAATERQEGDNVRESRRRRGGGGGGRSVAERKKEPKPDDRDETEGKYLHMQEYNRKRTFTLRFCPLLADTSAAISKKT